ncbi:MAG: Heme synthase, protoheme farnesyltransferase [Myxococcaceae bacterium]|nr:Heme synthase, protoheme farnesyltransferase [Myxococcaceae bacterium]
MTPIAASVEASKPAFETIALRDIVTLMKPRITLLVLITAAAGVWLAPVPISKLALALTMLGTFMIVSGANALNMYIERDIDGRMDRTKNRPLPAGRMSPRVALWFGVAISVLSIPILAIGVNAVTALLAVLANLSYVLAYTPLKQRSHWALLVGAVPGAIPPLMGWTAATAHVDAGGLALFGVLFFWQVPHFLAITLFRKEDYARAGLFVMPNVVGEDATKRSIVTYTAALVASTLLVFPLGISGRVYLVTAFVLGCTFLAWGTWGLRPTAGRKWARSLFAYSIVYLVLLLATMTANAT